MKTLIDKVAIVTGGSRGIGRAIAERLAQEGASVVINYVQSADKAQEVAKTIEATGGQALVVQADMSKSADIRCLFEKTVSYFGKLDILINNAATLFFKPIAEVIEEDFDYLFAVNTRGPFFALQKATQCMVDGGRIVNISTAATLICDPGTSAYVGSKAALEWFTKVLAKEVGRRGITVNTVSAGATVTDMFREMTPPEINDQLLKLTPLGRVGEPQDIADVVAFVVSEKARWLTGQTIRAVGGLVM